MTGRRKGVTQREVRSRKDLRHHIKDIPKFVPAEVTELLAESVKRRSQKVIIFSIVGITLFSLY